MKINLPIHPIGLNARHILACGRFRSAAVKELLWRIERGWNRYHFAKARFDGPIPVRFHRLDYYQYAGGSCSVHEHSALLKSANKICEGIFPSHGFGDRVLGLPPRWDADLISGLAWPLVPSARLKVVRNDGSDVKVPWDLSRLQFLPVLGKAWAVSGEDHYRSVAIALLKDWIKNNPLGWGVNWTIAMEASLRAMSICFLLDLLHPWPQDQRNVFDDAIRSLWQHFAFVSTHNEFSHFATSNHYLSNLAGLFCLSVHLDGGGMEQARSSLMEALEKEIMVQTFSDGGDYEASTGYHLLALQMFFAADRLARVSGIGISKDYRARLARMFHYLGGLSDCRYVVPQVGDCDDGRVEWTEDDLCQFAESPETPRDSLVSADWIALGRLLEGSGSPVRSQSAAWFGIEQQDISEYSRPDLCSFQQSGITTVRKGKDQLWFCAMPNGIQGKGSHTHNDKLAVILNINGEQLLTDSGTFVYTRDVAARNQFRSTRAHNTVMIDGLEQNSLVSSTGRLFRIGNEAGVGAIHSVVNDGVVELTASHVGYQRIGIIHHRRLQWANGRLMVEDLLAGSHEHSAEWNWIFPAPWDVKIHGKGNPSSAVIVQAGQQVNWSVQAPTATDVIVHAASVSRAMGATVPATRLTVCVRGSFPMTVRTYFNWDCDDKG